MASTALFRCLREAIPDELAELRLPINTAGPDGCGVSLSVLTKLA